MPKTIIIELPKKAAERFAKLCELNGSCSEALVVA